MLLYRGIQISSNFPCRSPQTTWKKMIKTLPGSNFCIRITAPMNFHELDMKIWFSFTFAVNEDEATLLHAPDQRLTGETHPTGFGGSNLGYVRLLSSASPRVPTAGHHSYFSFCNLAHSW
jgi:hypothetical protein